MQILVSELATQYIRSGKGKTILLLHGWGDSGQTYKALIQSLSKTYDCIALDLPGFGNTEPPKETWDLDNYAAFVADFLDKLGVRKLRGIIGHSNGGAVLIRGLSLGVLEADRAVLLSSAGIRDKGGLKRLGLKVVAKTGKALTFWLPLRHRKALQRKLYGVAGSDMLVTPRLKETFKRTVRQDIQVDARKISVPSLLIYGEQDRATPPEFGEKLASLIPNSHLELLASEHFVHHEQTDATAQLIKDFLS